MSEASLTLTLENRDEATLLFGNRDQHLRLIRDALGVRVIARGDTMQIEGGEEPVARAERVFHQLRQMLRQQGKLSQEELEKFKEFRTSAINNNRMALTMNRKMMAPVSK